MNDLAQLKNDEAVCSSLDVAKKFRKKHADVLRMIEGLLKNEGTHGMFKASHYVKKQNEQRYPMYLMNNDGLSLLVMALEELAYLGVA